MIDLRRVTARIAGKTCLHDVSLRLNPGENWVVLGGNGSGKTSLGQLLCGRLELLSGTAVLPRQGASVTFEDVTEILNAERYRDESDSRGGYDPGTSARAFILAGRNERRKTLAELEEKFQLRAFLNRGIKFLSTGEMRKALICRELLKAPELLVLDEPFDGLDQASCELLQQTIRAIGKDGTTVILLLNRLTEIPAQTTHLAIIDNLSIVAAGPVRTLLPKLKTTARGRFQFVSGGLDIPRTRLPAPEKREVAAVIEMRDVTVRYGGNRVLAHFDWTVLSNEHWMISGPNGAGKTTLLNLITGDNPQAYANDIKLFGRRKGSGESIWEIKQRIGQVSTSFQRDYRVGGKTIDVVLSGYYDSIGLYRRVNPDQRQTALEWLQAIHLEHKADTAYQKLSFGEQRLVLLARAMIKSPELLILDEPCQGLDETNRMMILQLIDHIGSNHRSQLLYVTHHPEDELGCINRHLVLPPFPV